MPPTKAKSTRKQRATAKERPTTRKRVQPPSPRESFLKPGPVIELREEHSLEAERFHMDNDLWERAKTQWMLGDWDGLAALELSTLENEPRRAELATLSACARLHKGEKQAARRSFAAASRWNCTPAFMVRALVASSEACVSRYHEISGRHEKATALLAASAGAFGGDGILAAKARNIAPPTQTDKHMRPLPPPSIDQHLYNEDITAHTDQGLPGCGKAVTQILKHSDKKLKKQETTVPYQVEHIFQILIVKDGRTPTSLSAETLGRIAQLQRLYPQARYHLFDGNQIRSLLAAHFQPCVLDAYDSLRPYAYKADLARYCLLYLYGGLYADLSISIASPHQIPSHYTITCFREPAVSSGSTCGINNGVLYARPQCEEFAIAIRLILNNCASKHYGLNPLAPTGPILFGRAIAAANKLDNIYCGQTHITDDGTPSFQDPSGAVLARSNKIGGTNNTSWGSVDINSYNKLWHDRDIYS
jgi:hypothetical protein